MRKSRKKTASVVRPTAVAPVSSRHQSMMTKLVPDAIGSQTIPRRFRLMMIRVFVLVMRSGSCRTSQGNRYTSNYDARQLNTVAHGPTGEGSDALLVGLRHSVRLSRCMIVQHTCAWPTGTWPRDCAHSLSSCAPGRRPTAVPTAKTANSKQGMCPSHALNPCGSRTGRGALYL